MKIKSIFRNQWQKNKFAVQWVIRAFKAHYTGSCLQQLVDAIDGENNFQLNAFWRNFTIASCVTVIRKALQDMEKETLSACWKKLWPECVHDYKGISPDEIHHDAVDKSVKLAQLIVGDGFDDVDKSVKLVQLIGGDGFDDVTHEELNEQ